MRLKRACYQAGLGLARSWWRVRGGRHLTVFGLKIVVAPETVFPHYRKFPLPKRGCKSEIVRYVDYVQLHSVMMYLEELRTPPTIVEVGAHHGAYAVLLGKKAKELGGTVVAVEPNPQACAVLKRNVALNGLNSTVVCEEVAVLDEPGQHQLVMQGDQSHIALRPSAEGCRVECVTLEALLSNHGVTVVDLLLIDTEGAEMLVLKGFPWGSVGIGRIYCELHPYAWEGLGYSTSDFERFLVDHEFRCYDMYLREHSKFERRAYIGPTLLVETRRRGAFEASQEGF
jgi:FkbM family methyltransferase